MNAIGISPQSAVGNGAIVAFSTVPNAPKLLTRDELLTTTSRIGLNWSDGDSNGGQPVLDYRISYQNLGIYEEIASGVIAKTYMTTMAVTGGTPYTLRVESRNSVGFSAPSDPIVILAATRPGQPAAPTTSVYLNDVTIKWVSPSANAFADYGAEIVGYKVSILANDGTYKTSAKCDGSLNSIVLSKSCVLTMTDLMSDPFNLGLGVIVQAKVVAFNVIGDSLASLPGSGAVIAITVSPDPPISLARNNLLTSPTQITLTWQAGNSNGGYPVIDYRVSTDQATGNWQVIATGVTTKSFTMTPVTAGSTYNFKVESRTLFGYSGYSEVFPILAATVPDQPQIPVTSVSINNLVVSWSAPYN